MDNAEARARYQEEQLTKFLAQLTPAQETNVLLREIRDQLVMIGTVLLRTDENGMVENMKLEDVIHNISPPKTPFLEAGAGALTRVTQSPKQGKKR